MALKGTYYAINGGKVTSPDTEQWSPVISGVDLTSHQKRSPYQELRWTKMVVGNDMEERATGQLDWFAFDNTTLEELTTVIPGAVDMYATYTDVVCQSVLSRKDRGALTQIVATFLVNLESAI